MGKSDQRVFESYQETIELLKKKKYKDSRFVQLKEFNAEFVKMKEANLEKAKNMMNQIASRSLSS